MINFGYSLGSDKIIQLFNWDLVKEDVFNKYIEDNIAVVILLYFLKVKK